VQKVKMILSVFFQNWKQLTNQPHKKSKVLGKGVIWDKHFYKKNCSSDSNFRIKWHFFHSSIFALNVSFLGKLCFLISILICGLGVESNAQIQPPSIISGVTFEWDGPQPTTTSPANLVSITVDGKVFNRFAAPSRYELSRLGPNGHNQNRIVENGVIIESASNTPTWNSNALAAFSSPNMNFIFESDGNGRNICSDFDQALTTDAQVQSIFYDNLQVVNQDGIIAISTRNANSCIYIEVLGAETFGGPEIVLSRFFARPGPSIVGPVFGQPAVGADYWRSGRVNANNGNIGIALFRLNEVAPLGSYITGIRYIGANVNHGDGKVFLIRSESADLSVVKTVNNLTPDYGDEIDFSIKAINNGLLNANGIQVTDLLPSGFNFISASTSRGTYNNTTGIWNIGSLNYGDVETLVIRARVNTTGDYTNLAQISSGPNDPNLENNISKVKVRPRNIVVANNLTVSTVANNPDAGNALENDLFNGNPILPREVNIRSVSPSNPLVTIDVDNGTITVGNVPSGLYTIIYTICEAETDPENTNCSTATVTVLVSNELVASDDSLISSANNNNIGNIFEDNGNGPDVLNGETVTILNVSIRNVIASNPLVTVDVATGNIMVGDVPVGTYQIEYTICETGTDPAESNCSTATVTVEVRNLIVANDDLVTTSANNPNAGNVLEDNGNGADTFNGTELTAGQVSVSVVSTSNPLVTLDTATGNISVGNVVSGSYTIDYTICETGTDPAESNCSTATVTVEVRNLIVANDDLVTTAANNPNAGNVLEDNGNGADTFNGKGLTAGQVSISVVSTSHPLVTLDTATGNIVVGEVGGGTFEVAYSICEIGSNPVNCKSAVVTVIVEIEDIKIEANDDIVQDVRGKSGAVNIINILDNDLLNGEAINLSDVIISVSGNQVLNPIPFTNSNSLPESNVVLNPDGSVNVAADTEPDTYVLDYSICSSSDPSICDTATIRVIVQVSSIIANDDNYGPLNGILGATFGNVIENDSINGIPVNLSDVILSWLSGSPELTLNEDGSITLASNTPSGEYILLYNLCEARDPNNCVTAIVKVVVIGEVDLSIEKTSNGIEVWGSEVFEYLITVSNIGLADATNVTIEDLLPEGIDFESQEVKSSISSLEINFEQQGNKLIWTLPVLPVNVNVDIRLNVLAQNIEGTKPFVVINNATVKGEELETNLNNNSATDINAINPFFIPNVFTPNGNGVNDTFEIVGINKFVKNDLVIFNRFGDEIFHAENYRNNWDASGLVAGTYFYVLRGVDRFGVNQEFKGWIQVVKK
jgi:uncharacterized repeat protein (TIGR01451 family)/gliding motility-associated-like protein